MSSTPNRSSFILANSLPKTVIVTGGSGDIGAATASQYAAAGCNVVIADLASTRSAAELLISRFPTPSRAFFHPADITNWSDMRSLFREAKDRFGQVDIVVANAGIMESHPFFDFDEDENGELKEPREAWKVVDVNLKGTMNTLQLAFHSMKSNLLDTNQSRGSITVIASTSGYFGGTGVVSYISSKHGVVGLARASQKKANELNIRVNVVAPFFTPTYITTGYAKQWKEKGLPENKVEDVARVIVETSMDEKLRGASVTVAGGIIREIETRRTEMTRMWLGDEIANVMEQGGKFFDEMGGYTLPKARE